MISYGLNLRGGLPSSELNAPSLGEVVIVIDGDGSFVLACSEIGAVRDRSCVGTVRRESKFNV